MKETKTQMILRVLSRRKGGINSLEAMRWGGTRVAARINDLKRKGIEIETFYDKKRKDGSVIWRLQQQIGR